MRATSVPPPFCNVNIGLSKHWGMADALDNLGDDLARSLKRAHNLKPVVTRRVGTGLNPERCRCGRCGAGVITRDHTGLDAHPLQLGHALLGVGVAHRACDQPGQLPSGYTHRHRLTFVGQGSDAGGLLGSKARQFTGGSSHPWEEGHAAHIPHLARMALASGRDEPVSSAAASDGTSRSPRSIRVMSATTGLPSVIIAASSEPVSVREKVRLRRELNPPT